MTIEDIVLEKLRKLSAEDQQKVLEFVESLKPPKETPRPCKDPRGLFVHRGVHITAEEIAESRRQAWSNFPRDFPEGAAS
jgi:hypothetical protein